MLILREECKYLLRSRFLWVVAVLGIFICIISSMISWSYSADDFALGHRFVQENGLSFTEEDAVKYAQYYFEQVPKESEVKVIFEKAGIQKLTEKEIKEIYIGFSMGEEAFIKTETGKKLGNAIFNHYDAFHYFYSGLALVEQTSMKDYQGWSLEFSNMLQMTLPQWKQEFMIPAAENLYQRKKEIIQNNENHLFLPIVPRMSSNRLWFDQQFGLGGIGILWVVAFVLAGVAASRSLGRSFRAAMAQITYTGKNGRKLSLYKILSVLVVSAGIYLLLSLLITMVYVLVYRLDLYWNVPMSSMNDRYSGAMITRFPITIGGYWWFQLGVGLGTVVIMALIFSASMLFTRSFYAGSAISIGSALLLLCLIQMVPEMQDSLLLMGSPVGLFLNTGKFLQQDFLLSILPHFEGVMLLIWGGLAAILTALGFIRFRRSTL